MDTSRRDNEASAVDHAFAVMDQLALVKPAENDGQPGYTVLLMDGTPLGWFDQLDVAFAAVRQHDLTPVNVH
jgi:hypothetical protein